MSVDEREKRDDGATWRVKFAQSDESVKVYVDTESGRISEAEMEKLGHGAEFRLNLSFSTRAAGQEYPVAALV